MSPGNFGLSKWLGTGKMTAVKASKMQGSVNHTGGCFLVTLALWPFFAEPGYKVPRFEIVKQRQEIDPQV